MEKYIIEGGNPLCGEVSISGAKNSVLGLIAASILSKETTTLHNIPNITDVSNLLESMQALGVQISYSDKNKIKINNKYIKPFIKLDYDYIKKMRASYYLLGALLGRYKQATIALPGGCDIGSRPIDQHIKGLTALGASIKLEHGFIVAKTDKLIGNKIRLDFPSVGATINILLASVLAEGKTIILNAAKEPHIVDIANMLNYMGASIHDAGTDRIVIYGVKALHGCEYTAIPDQIEAGTFMVASAITNGNIKIKNIIPKHLESIISKLREMGIIIIEHEDEIEVIGTNNLIATKIITNPYPGFPTDMHPQFAVLCGLAKGKSYIEETIFERRFKYVDELRRLGADIKTLDNLAIINGISGYQGTQLDLPDLRAGAALVLAALASFGVSELENIHYVERGYENFVEKLQLLGANIHKEKCIENTKLKLII